MKRHRLTLEVTIAHDGNADVDDVLRAVLETIGHPIGLHAHRIAALALVTAITRNTDGQFTAPMRIKVPKIVSDEIDAEAFAALCAEIQAAGSTVHITDKPDAEEAAPDGRHVH